MRMKKRIFLSLMALLTVAFTYAAVDFTAECSSGQTLAYTIIDASSKTCEVTQAETNPTGNVVIPASVVNPNDAETYTVVGVGSYAFQETSAMTGVTFPTASTFTTIKNFAFYQSHIGAAIIPDNVTTLGDQAFRDSYIQSVHIGSGVSTIPSCLFFDCSKLKRVVFPNTVTEIGNAIFFGSGVKYVELGNAVSSVSASSFGSDYSSWAKSVIDTIVIHTPTPPTVKQDYSYGSTFYNELANRCLVFVPSTAVEDYKAHAKWGAFKVIVAEGTNVVRYTLTVDNKTSSYIDGGSHVYVNGERASNSSYTLSRYIVLDEEKISIELKPQLYWGVASVTLNGVDILSQFTDHKATLTLTEDATLKVRWAPVNPYDFSEKVASGQKLFFRITDATNHKVKITNQTGGRSVGGYTSTGYAYFGRVYSSDSEDYWISGGPDMPSGDLIIPTQITHEGTTYTIEEIDTLAFSGSNLSSVYIPEGIKALRAGAFYESNVKGDLFLPQSCEVMEPWAFRDCKLSSVSTGGVKVLEEYIFLNNSSIKEFKSTPAHTQIKGYALDMYYIEYAEIGENVTMVASSAFYDCSKLKTVVSYATTPPVMKGSADQSYESTSWSGFSPSAATLYVPKSEGSTVLAAYKAANCWKLFGTILELPDQYTITTAVKDAGTGNVTGGGKYEENATATLNAVPAPHYDFVKWSDNNTDNPRTVTVTSDATYTAEFAPHVTAVGDIITMNMAGKDLRFKVTSVNPNEIEFTDEGGGSYYYRSYEGIDKEFDIPATVKDYWGVSFQTTSISGSVLYDNYGLKVIRIPEGVRTVKDRAFLSMDALEEIYYPSTIESIGYDNATYNYKLKAIHFAGADNLKYIGTSQYNSLNIWTNATSNAVYAPDGVALFYKGSTPDKSRLDIPEGVKFIGDRLFNSNGGSTNTVRLPSTLKGLSKEAFGGGNVQTVYTFAVNPPAVEAGKDPLVGYAPYAMLYVDCSANYQAYLAHDYWKTLSTKEQRSAYFVDVTLNTSSQGSATVTYPTCGTAHIEAFPNTYYEVKDWSTGAKEVNAIDVVLTQDTNITVNFQTIRYTVRFLDWDGTEVYPSVKVTRGNSIGSIPALPQTKTGWTAQYWKRSDNVGDQLGAIYQNVDYTAYYTVNQYKVTFKNWDGTVLQEGSQDYGTTIYYTKAEPTRDQSESTVYTFNGWNPAFVSGETTLNEANDMVFTAQYSESARKYDITFNDEDGTFLIKQEVAWGEVPVYAGKALSKPADDTYTYAHTGWTPELKAVDGDATYTAVYTPTYIDYTIAFTNWDDEVLKTFTLHYGDVITYADEPTRAQDDEYSYAFSGWDPAFESGVTTVAGNQTYKAQYDATQREYTITFVNYDETVLDQQVLHWNDAITYKGEEPKRDADKQYIYTFAGWEPELATDAKVAGDATYTAQYSTKTQKYTVTFLTEEGGELIDEIMIAYGGDATDLAPKKEDLTAPEDKRFGGWSEDITFVESNMTVWPIWKDKIYTVLFIDPLDNDRVIEEYENVAHGKKVTPPAAPEHEGYTFVGWDSDAYLNVTDDLVIKAVYEKIQGLNNLSAEAGAVKVLRDGQLYLMYKGTMYNVQGAKVK